MLDLEALPFGLGQALVVRHFLHEHPDLVPETALQLIRRGIGVLDGVVQHRAHERHQVAHATDGGQHRRHFDGVIDVG